MPYLSKKRKVTGAKKRKKKEKKGKLLQTSKVRPNSGPLKAKTLCNQIILSTV
jgi:hypothetical protein